MTPKSLVNILFFSFKICLLLELVNYKSFINDSSVLQNINNRLYKALYTRLIIPYIVIISLS